MNKVLLLLLILTLSLVMPSCADTEINEPDGDSENGDEETTFDRDTTTALSKDFAIPIFQFCKKDT